MLTQKLPALHGVMTDELAGQYDPLVHVVGAVEPAAHHERTGQITCTDVLAQ